jgi:hypothetical protein
MKITCLTLPPLLGASLTHASASPRPPSLACTKILSIPTSLNVKILNATYVEAGAFNATGGAPYQTTTNSFPCCRVFGLINVKDQSTVNFEILLPNERDYNGRYLAVGALEAVSWRSVDRKLTKLGKAMAVLREISARSPCLEV